MEYLICFAIVIAFCAVGYWHDSKGPFGQRQWRGRSFSVLALVCAAACWIWFGAPKPAQPQYAFNIPAMFLTCMEYEVPAFESFGNFNIEQPMRIPLNSGSRLHDSRMVVYNWCGWNAIDIRT